jgi:phosphatidylinositol kinase/protein kinase (PI-3  family)
MHLADDVDLSEHSSRIIQSFLRFLSSTASASESSLQSAVLIGLSTLVCRLGDNYIPYIIPARRCIRVMSTKIDTTKLVQLEDYECLISRLLKQRPLPTDPNDFHEIAIARVMSNRRQRITSEVNHKISVQALETAWALGNVSSSFMYYQ